MDKRTEGTNERRYQGTDIFQFIFSVFIPCWVTQWLAVRGWFPATPPTILLASLQQRNTDERWPKHTWLWVDRKKTRFWRFCTHRLYSIVKFKQGMTGSKANELANPAQAPEHAQILQVNDAFQQGCTSHRRWNKPNSLWILSPVTRLHLWSDMSSSAEPQTHSTNVCRSHPRTS